MGGGVCTLFLEKYPNVFKKAVLSAPMIDLLYRGVTRLMCRAACRFCVITGRAEKAVFISKKDYAKLLSGLNYWKVPKSVSGIYKYIQHIFDANYHYY